MAKKYTRKQLRQPDEFISFWTKVLEAARDNLPKVVVMVVVATLVVAGVWTWTYFSEARAQKATSAMSKAFEAYNQPILPMASKLPPPKDGKKRYKSEKEKLDASEKKFTEAMKTSGGSLKALSQLMRAGVRYELRRYDDAIKDYKVFLSSSAPEPLKVNAREGIGYCYEAKKQWDKALAEFRKLPQQGERKWQSMYQQARMLARQGKKADAVKMLTSVSEKAKSRSLQEQAGEQLAFIEQGK